MGSDGHLLLLAGLCVLHRSLYLTKEVGTFQCLLMGRGEEFLSALLVSSSVGIPLLQF